MKLFNKYSTMLFGYLELSRDIRNEEKSINLRYIINNRWSSSIMRMK